MVVKENKLSRSLNMFENLEDGNVELKLALDLVLLNQVKK